MNTTHIQCFLSVADCKSFTDAALSMFYSQQTVSKYIAQLEKDLGATLFDRTSQSIRLTAAGRYYYVLFQAAYQRLSFVSDEIGRYYNDLIHNLTIGCSEWLNPFGEINDGIQFFRQEHPDVSVSMRKRNNKELLNELVTDVVDVALFSEGHLPLHRDIESTPVGNEHLCIFGPDNVVGELLPVEARMHRVNIPYLMVPGWDRSHTENIVLSKQELELAEFSPNSVRFLPNVESMRAEMRLSRGIAVSDRRFGFLNTIPGLGHEPIQDRTSLFCCRRQLSENPLVDDFILLLKELFNRHN